ncbi:MAG: TolC family protein [Legionella longbeachae]|nr:TolC family protein [Legionella longbeachae]
MKLKIILINLLAILLGSCCKTCIIHHEKVKYPESTRSGIKYIHDKTELSRIAWWKKLKDPQLNQFITQALSCNNQIKSSYATIEQAQAQLKTAQYAWIPTLDASANGFAGGTWNSHINPNGSLANNPFFANRSNISFRGYYSGFVPSYTFNILNNINNIKAAKASLAIQQAQTQSTKLGIISQMSGTYFMLLSQREQLAVEKTLSRDLRKLRQLEKVRFQKGASDIETIMSIDQQIAQEEAKIPQIENIVTQSENTIHLLLNQNPGPIATHQRLHSLNLNHLIPQYLPSSVLKNRPDIMIALNNLKRANAEIGVAYSAFFPTISLTGLVGKASVDLTNLLKISTNIWIAQATGATKIFNPSAYQNIKSAKAGFNATYYEYLQTLRSAFADVDDNLTYAQKNRLSYLKIQKGYLAAKQAYTISLTQYKAGAKDYRNVVNAKINLGRNQLSLLQEKAQLLDSIVQVYNAVAGGYDVDKCEGHCH